MRWLLIVTTLIVAFLLKYLFRRQHNNVCKTFEDYYTNRDTNPNCYNNPDVDLTIPEIVINRGYPLETHRVTTDDNYILTIFRINHGKENITGAKKTVLIVHGFGLNCGCFVTIGNKSLAFVLADNGYDVWLGNYRATIFSSHKYLNKADDLFWSFTLNEYVDYDMKNMINFVYNATNRKIVFIGYSLSTAMFFTYSSKHVQHSLEKINVNVALAPVFNIREWKSVFSYIPWNTLTKYIGTAVADYKVMNSYPLIQKYLCLPYPFQLKTCMLFYNLLEGWSNKQLDPETLPVSVIHNVDATSFKVVHHLMQLFRGNDGQWYDYGTKQNLEIYGTRKPIKTNLSNMKIPTYLLSANNDAISTPLNVELLYKNLTNAVKYKHVVEDDDFSHADFFRGKDVFLLVYQHIIKFLEDFK
ncbi:hypothetical protein RN001_002967 [Aquatica leii]|uniref:Lipase n=1 Tax=Aquatica leii TaxID=1421715 RepID=A0AAN7SDM4_9COLE|nr:hypothetical protein RN001_002967 [Aquatica leii]